MKVGIQVCRFFPEQVTKSSCEFKSWLWELSTITFIYHLERAEMYWLVCCCLGFFVLLPSQVRRFHKKARDLYKALCNSTSEVPRDQEGWAQDAEPELILFFFSLTVAVTRADFNFGAKIKTPLWLLCVFHIFTSTSLFGISNSCSCSASTEIRLGEFKFWHSE